MIDRDSGGARVRRHHNNKGYRQIRMGRLYERVEKMKGFLELNNYGQRNE